MTESNKKCYWRGRECTYEEWFDSFCKYMDSIPLREHDVAKALNLREYNKYVDRKTDYYASTISIDSEDIVLANLCVAEEIDASAIRVKENLRKESYIHK